MRAEPVESDRRLEESLRAAGFRGKLAAGSPLAPLTSWRIGGPAELLARPEDRADLQVALEWAARGRLPWRVLGNGSNLLVRDEGVAGLVLHMRRALNGHRLESDRLVAEAGVFLPALSRLTAAAGLSGLEFGAGIPATLGGALVMNAGWHEYEIGQLVEWIDFLDESGDPHRSDRASAEFVYRGSRFRGARCILVEACLRLKRARPTEIRARLDRFAASRKENQPTELPSCGSVFLKPPGDFAGRLIEEAGLKGLRVGAIEVSRKHANFFVNTGGGTAADVLALVRRVEEEVESKFGVRLVREFELW
jgi:UDP-N-acetylmuramate dehydrogenase